MVPVYGVMALTASELDQHIAPQQDNSAAHTASSGLQAQVAGPMLTPTVSAGPVILNTFGGLPLVAVTESVRHYSGRRLAGFFYDALTQAGCTFEPTAEQGGDGVD